MNIGQKCLEPLFFNYLTKFRNTTGMVKYIKGQQYFLVLFIVLYSTLRPPVSFVLIFILFQIKSENCSRRVVFWWQYLVEALYSHSDQKLVKGQICSLIWCSDRSNTFITSAVDYRWSVMCLALHYITQSGCKPISRFPPPKSIHLQTHWHTDTERGSPRASHTQTHGHYIATVTERIQLRASAVYYSERGRDGVGGAEPNAVVQGRPTDRARQAGPTMWWWCWWW